MTLEIPSMKNYAQVQHEKNAEELVLLNVNLL